jgi:hypothetical protein
LPPFIMVMPHGDYALYTGTSGGDKSFEGVLVNELIPAIDGRFRTLADAEHRAIGGISRGGVWALEIAFRHPELFDAVGGHSPALSVNRATDEYDPLELARSASIDKLRIFLDAGDQDWTRAGTQDLSKASRCTLHPPYIHGGQRRPRLSLLGLSSGVLFALLWRAMEGRTGHQAIAVRADSINTWLARDLAS